MNGEYGNGSKFRSYFLYSLPPEMRPTKEQEIKRASDALYQSRFSRGRIEFSDVHCMRR